MMQISNKEKSEGIEEWKLRRKVHKNMIAQETKGERKGEEKHIGE